MWDFCWDCTGTSAFKVYCGVSGHCLALRILKQLSQGSLRVPSDRHKCIDLQKHLKKLLKAELQMLHGLCIYFICISSEESLKYHSIQLPYTQCRREKLEGFRSICLHLFCSLWESPTAVLPLGFRLQRGATPTRHGATATLYLFCDIEQPAYCFNTANTELWK